MKGSTEEVSSTVKSRLLDHPEDNAQVGSEDPAEAQPEIPMAQHSNEIHPQIRMDGALHRSGFKRSDVTPYEGGNWEIVGEDSQILVVKVQAGQSVMCEPGGMLTKGASTEPTIDMGTCSLAFKRCCCARESCFRVVWSSAAGEDVVTITPYFPSKVLPIDMLKYRGLFIKKKAWMATVNGTTEFDVTTASSCTTACCAGQGCFITALTGTGTAFLSVGGTVVEKVLGEGEQRVLEDSSLVAWEPTVTLEVARVGGCGVMLCGGQGLFQVVVTGPGLVIVQSMSFEKARGAYMREARGHGKSLLQQAI
mmetsp:Transcript_29175/g.59785  ORF Transcript_29175/g.59785 Transcript_29175/m.59785 type:complete len:308 (+) Transcript_29175:122-1045(+)|eukprot:CAMPEP_0181300758 /NCGR_PEP_ID=MMETSP1101-20121128/7060_1 /TAXON_ID=46948 /ORGANISM="Rhodomonas abbreviata, Strain Caron Lab Isolate" /LENGTH=307 /DNA_ID=CAMNT_0023406015 /DNA_START=118 /DNA_END=1041 /DNA_ORIENTATION=+